MLQEKGEYDLDDPQQMYVKSNCDLVAVIDSATVGSTLITSKKTQLVSCYLSIPLGIVSDYPSSVF